MSSDHNPTLLSGEKLLKDSNQRYGYYTGRNGTGWKVSGVKIKKIISG